MPCAGELLVRQPVQQVQLADRGAAQAVDHQRDPVARGVRQVGDDRAQQLVDDLVGARPAWRGGGRARRGCRRRPPSRRRPARTAASPWPAGCTAVRAMPMVRVTELTFSPIRTSSSSDAPASDGRADGLHDEEVARDAAPADRPGRVLDRDVVVDEQRPHVQALGLGQLGGHLERHLVAGVVVDQQQDALVRGQQLGGLQHVLHGRRREHVARDRRRRACPCRPP